MFTATQSDLIFNYLDAAIHADGARYTVAAPTNEQCLEGAMDDDNTNYPWTHEALNLLVWVMQDWCKDNLINSQNIVDNFNSRV